MSRGKCGMKMKMTILCSMYNDKQYYIVSNKYSEQANLFGFQFRADQIVKLDYDYKEYQTKSIRKSCAHRRNHSNRKIFFYFLWHFSCFWFLVFLFIKFHGRILEQFKIFHNSVAFITIFLLFFFKPSWNLQKSSIKL